MSETTEQSAVELLRSVPLFADLEEGELERFSHVAVPRSFPAGTRVEYAQADLCRQELLVEIEGLAAL